MQLELTCKHCREIAIHTLYEPYSHHNPTSLILAECPKCGFRMRWGADELQEQIRLAHQRDLEATGASNLRLRSLRRQSHMAPKRSGMRPKRVIEERLRKDRQETDRLIREVEEWLEERGEQGS
jgi:hypothetical protein